MRYQGQKLIDTFEKFLKDHNCFQEFISDCETYGGQTYKEYKTTWDWDSRRYDIVCSAFKWSQTENEQIWAEINFKWNQYLNKLEHERGR